MQLLMRGRQQLGMHGKKTAAGCMWWYMIKRQGCWNGEGRCCEGECREGECCEPGRGRVLRWERQHERISVRAWRLLRGR